MKTYRINILNTSLRVFCKNLDNVEFVKLAPAESLYFSYKDGIHLTDAGKEVYARNLVNFYNYLRVCEEWKNEPARPFSIPHRQLRD